jgi:hypothetical protein
MTRKPMLVVVSLMTAGQAYAFEPLFDARIDYRAGHLTASVFCADLDNDNDPDLAVANRRPDNIFILKNNGDGSYQSAVDYGTGDDPNSVFCADLDGDTDLDLALANNLGSNVSVLFNCRAAGDCNQDDVVDIGDAVYPIWLMIWRRVFP